MSHFTKYWISAMLLTMAQSMIYSQVTNKPTGSTFPPAPDSVHTEAGYPSTILVNFMRTRTANGPFADSVLTGSNFTSIGDKVNITTDYYDGLGRDLQKVEWHYGIDGSYYDRFTPMVYDAFGREVYKYMPFDDNKNLPGVEGFHFHTNPFTRSVFSRLQQEHPSEKVFYAKTEYEASPINRVTKIMQPGNSWVGKGRGTIYQYLVNAASDSVVIWNIGNDTLTYVNNDTATNLPKKIGYYGPGQLRKNVVTDEMGNTTVVYLDKSNRTILKKIQADSAIATDLGGYAGWLSTYYIYDDLGLLRFVISPKAVRAIRASWTISPTVASELCFHSEYDSRNRLIAKGVPGAGWIYFIYDKRDRLVYTQDANLKAKNQWQAILYDGLNRSVATGIIPYAGGRSSLQNYASQSASMSAVVYTAPPVPSLYVNERLTAVYTYKAGQDISFLGEFASEPTAEFVTLIDSTAITTDSISTLNNPLPPGSNFIALTLAYYDDYAWNNGSNKQFVTDGISKVNGINGFYLDTVSTVPSAQTLGLLTGSKVRILSDPNNLSKGTWLATVNFYDDKSRIAEAQADNLKGGIDLTINRYNFHDILNVTYQTHRNPAALSLPITLTTQKLYQYSDVATGLQQRIGDSGEMKTIARIYEYNINRQIQRKILNRMLGSVDYAYNLRGGLRGINDYYVDPNLPPSNSSMWPLWFGEVIGYDSGFEKNQYGGNIAGIKWKSEGNGVVRAYGFGYDKSGRLMSADFNQLFGSTWAKSDPASSNYKYDFSVQMGDGNNSASAYDENGNILSMKQWGLKLNASPLIDDLTYNYFPTANKLLNVIDAVNDTATKLGDFRTSAGHPVQNKTNTTVDYAYDFNGNLVKDLNKDIGTSTVSGIEYNHLNLPYRITVFNRSNIKGTITYIYDAKGNKLEKRVSEFGQPDNWTSYIGPFQYQNDSLQFFAHEEGRVRVKRSLVDNQPKTDYIYDYFVKDHLGNIRMVLTEENQQDIYPVASLENASDVALGSLYYNINSGNIVDRSAVLALPNYPNNNGIPTNNPAVNPADNSQKVYRLNGSSTATKMGLGITLRVMAGDTVSIFGKSYWKTAAGTVPGQPSGIVLLDLLNAFVGAGLPGTKTGPSGSTLNSLPEVTGPLTTFLNGQGQTQVNPKAYINWILFDENFYPVVNSGTNSGFDQVDSSGKLKTHTKTTGAIKKSGYLFIYCSNESQVDVFFDNLQVVHGRGPLLEETHYYPFGLTMAGISSQALKTNYTANKKKFQGQELANKEFSDGSGLEMYEFKWRMDDPQTGRFWQIDPLASKYEYNSPYAFSENKVTSHVELEGLEAQSITNDAWREVQSSFQHLGNWFDNTFSVFNKSSTSTVVSSTPVSTTSVGTTVTTSVSTNFGESMSYIVANNSNQGNTAPLTKTTTSVTADTKTDIKTSVGTITNKTTVSTNGTVSNETGAKRNVVIEGVPATVGGSVSKSTNGQTTVTAQGSTNSGKVQGVTQVQYSTNGKQQSASVGIGGQGTAGKTTTTTIFGIKISW